MDLNARIDVLIESIMARPEMYAFTREAYIAQLATLLNLRGIDGGSLYTLFLEHNGPAMFGLALLIDKPFLARVNAAVAKLMGDS